MASYEQRHTFRLLSYWNNIKEEDKFPDLSEVSLAEMGDLWDYCFILDVGSPDDPEFTHFGSELISVFGSDYTTKKLSDAVIHPVLADISSFIKEVWLMEAPVSHCGEVSHEDEKLLYRSLLAPISENEDETIHYMIGTSNFRHAD